MSFQPPPEIELIRQLSRTAPARPAKPAPAYDNTDDAPFVIQSGEDWLKSTQNEPDAKMLFDKFWFEGELCILFADTNVGKSILAVQIGDSISRGETVGNFEMQAQPSTVLYFDFELSQQQFHKRYSGGAYGNYRFGPKFLRAVINPAGGRAAKFSKYEDYISNALENALIRTKATVLIIDNITCLRYGTHAAAGALNLVRNLQALKSKYKLSILVLAHTPKRNPVKPVTRNDLQGSKMLINLCDSAFAIGESQSIPNQRYLKQIKQRSIHQAFGAANVHLCHIIKPYNFLSFDFTATANENDHLMHYSEQSRRDTETRVAQLSQQGQSHRQIAAQLNISSATVCRILKRLQLKTDATS